MSVPVVVLAVCVNVVLAICVYCVVIYNNLHTQTNLVYTVATELNCIIIACRMDVCVSQIV